MAYWDPCNKWLYLGEGEGQGKPWIIMLDNWLGWRRSLNPRISEWSLFRVMWDDGAFWAFDLDNALILDGYKVGWLNCFVE